jgi:hypothetical protein
MQGLCFATWILLVCYMEMWGAWTWLGCYNSFKMLPVAWTLFRCCNLRCCGFCCLELIELRIQFLYFYNIFICKLLDLDLCFMFIFRVQTFTYSDFCTLRYTRIQFFVFFHYLGIYWWNWNLVLESFVEVEFQIQEILKVCI